MEEYTYYYADEINLHIFDTRWLSNIGLKETQWILDATWIMDQHEISFNEWIDR